MAATTERGATSGAPREARFPLITDEALDELRQRIGQPFARPRPHVTQATLDSIRHWVLGIGDDNPLWLDPEYAASTRWKGITAPGTFLFAFDRVVSGYIAGLPGIHAMFAGTDWNWHAPIRLGDSITAEPTLKDLRDMKSSFSGRSVLQTYHVVFRNQHDTIVCETDSWCIRTQRDVARERSSSGRELAHPKVWTPEEIAVVADHYEHYRRRGAEPRWFEDVAVGDTVGPMLRGPSTVTSFVCFTQGWGSLYVKAHKQAFDMFRDHPALGIPNDLGVPEPPERVHWDSELARAVGVPAAYDYGPERISWLGNLVTDWMGDDAFLKRLNVQVRRHNIIGDLTTCEGTVAKAWQEGGENLVELSVRGFNQNGEETAVGMAVVALPSRSVTVQNQ